MEIRVVYIAEIVGKAGVLCVKKLLPRLKQLYEPDLIVANADGATGCAGLGKNHAGYLRKLGIEVITGGDCIYFKKDMVDSFGTMGYVLRPANFPSESPGRGWKLCKTEKGPVAVISLLGQTGFSRVHADNPFTKFNTLVEHIGSETRHILIDYHGATTAEKRAFAYFADGRASAVIGSHGRVQTADDRVLHGGTGAITDAGRTGSVNSVGGCYAATKISEYVTGIPDWTRETDEMPEIQGVSCVFSGDGRCTGMTRFRIPLEERLPPL